MNVSVPVKVISVLSSFSFNQLGKFIGIFGSFIFKYNVLANYPRDINIRGVLINFK